jgi:predicted RNase H-like HicB family nuclease
MKLTAVFEPAKEGGYTCFVEEIPAAISQGETLVEAKANLLDALKLVLECQRDLAEKDLSSSERVFLRITDRGSRITDHRFTCSGPRAGSTGHARQVKPR